jgi:PadR family transcriptional regulator, regulatory protein PadR
MTDDIASWQSQLRKGAAELIVLAVLDRGEAYGLQILDRANDAGDLVTDGALYPLLARLERAGRIEARWSAGKESANPRKYYRLTPDGARLLGRMRAIWAEFRSGIDRATEEA